MTLALERPLLVKGEPGTGKTRLAVELARAGLVKDEKHFVRYDRVFAAYFRGVVGVDEITVVIPEEWLRRLAEKLLTGDEKKLIEALGGWDRLMEMLRKRLEQQRGRHQGGGKWVGRAGISPCGAWGYNPEGVRIGQGVSRHRRAAKAWERREYRTLDDAVGLGTRNMKVALRRLRRFARIGAPEELDLDDTIRAAAKNAGWLDLRMVPERHNAVKVLLFLDVGGSMDDHVRVCEQLFSAARAEFKHLEYFCFHNFLSERVWLQRLLAVYPNAIWLNPQPESVWDYHESMRITRRLMGDRMFPLTLEGLERGMRFLSKSHWSAPLTPGASAQPGENTGRLNFLSLIAEVETNGQLKARRPDDRRLELSAA